MSTHIRPRPPTQASPSPARPTTARSTIRAITPSPTQSLDEALRMDLASAGTPSLEPGSASVRPKSDSFQEHDDQSISDVDFPRPPTHGTSKSAGLQRGGGVMGRRSPVKRNSRSRSPEKKPYSTPTDLASHQEGPSSAIKTPKNKDQDDDCDSDSGCPDTPTPMTTSQKRSAYTPLGQPIRYSAPEKTTNQVSSHTLDDYETIDLTRRSEPIIPSNDPSLEPVCLTPPQPQSHLHPPQRKPLPPNTNIARQISVSAQSNVSGGTVASKRSIFSTPGRDELERKKALVEQDEGPFAKAVSMNDLTERRRVASGGPLGDDEGKKEQKSRRFCGMEVGCSVM